MMGRNIKFIGHIKLGYIWKRRYVVSNVSGQMGEKRRFNMFAGDVRNVL